MLTMASSFWTQYAQVMEFNRQRMALQSASRSVSFFDIPSFQMVSSYGGTEQCNHLTFDSHQHEYHPGQYSRRRTNEEPCNHLSFDSHQHEFHPRHYSRQRTNEDVIPVDSDIITEDRCEEDLQRPEFIIDEGFIQFLEISMEHKLKRKKQLQAENLREKLRKKEEESEGSNLIGVKHSKRKKFKTNLYGQQANKIMAMENAMDISFNQQKDMNKPVLWPNIPLNL